MKVAPVEISLEAARAAYEKADAAVLAAKAVYEDALAALDMLGAHAAVDAFYDAVRVLGAAAKAVRAAMAKDEKDAFGARCVQLPLQCRCEPSAGGEATMGAPLDSGYAMSRKPIVSRDDLWWAQDEERSSKSLLGRSGSQEQEAWRAQISFFRGG